MRIIVVDQDTATLDKIEIYLLSIGCDDLHFARSPAEALKTLHKNTRRPFDCMLLDLDLTEVDYRGFVSRVHAVAGHDDLPVLMFSEQPPARRAAQARAAGAAGCLPKPVAPLDLLTWLKSALNARCEGGWLMRGAAPRRQRGRGRPIQIGALPRAGAPMWHKPASG